MYKVVQIWPGLIVCKQVTVCPGHIWTTLYYWPNPKWTCVIHVRIWFWWKIPAKNNQPPRRHHSKVINLHSKNGEFNKGWVGTYSVFRITQVLFFVLISLILQHVSVDLFDHYQVQIKVHKNKFKEVDTSSFTNTWYKLLQIYAGFVIIPSSGIINDN